MREAIAVACSDIHLSDKAPVARAGEPDWHGKQREALEFITSTARKLNVPLLMAGDLFHNARATPAMEILAMQAFKGVDMIKIPGQHDLQNHKIENEGKGSYGVFTEFHKWTVMSPTTLPVDLYPYGAEFHKASHGAGIAMIHHLVWQGKPPYPGAPEEGNVSEIVKRFPGYQFIVAGDNHKGFTCKVGDTTVVNCGSMMRRTADQEDYKPRCYVLYDNGDAEPVYLPIENDIFTREHRDDKIERDARVSAFVSKLKDIEVELSFEGNLDRFCKTNEIDSDIVEIIQEAINGRP